MTPQEAIRILIMEQEAISSLNTPEERMTTELFELNQVCKEALEKQIPKKPIEVFNSKLVHCEECGNIIKSARKWCDEFCDHCGQAIDWESDNQ